MNKRGIFGALALLLALTGGALLFVYVNGADERALASMDPGPVVVVVEEIPAGLSSEELLSRVEVRQIPRQAIVPGSLSSLDELPEDQVAVTTLEVGEQLLPSRFVGPDDNLVAASVPIPEGLQLVSIQLPPERVVGSQISAGDKVGIFVSAEVEVREVTGAPATPAPVPSATASEEEDTHHLTKLIANDVLVVRIQGAPAPQPTSAATDSPESLPGSEAIVTLAVDSDLAGQLVFSKEFGTIWLSRQTATTDFAEGEIIGAWTVFG